jgi:hypothetical protein
LDWQALYAIIQDAELTYVVGIYGNGKYGLFTSDAALVMVDVSVVVVVGVDVVPLPNTAPPVVVAAVAKSTVPVHFAPVGQQAITFAPSVLQTEPEVQHAPAYPAASVEQEL